VINLLGTDNAISVFSRSGDPKDDGWLGTAEGKNRALDFGSDANLYRTMYQAFNGGLNADINNSSNVLLTNNSNFGPPRQIRFGVKIEY
jgi:hypothetical protein